jgi:hypothetical protein
MMNIRWIPLGVVASGVLLLSGCVAVPGSYGYDNGYNGYYSQPSYYEPAPVMAPSVYIQGGTYYDRGYYTRDNRGYYDGHRRGYDGGRRDDGRAPDRPPRPAVNPAPRPNVNIPGQSPRVTGYPPFQSPADRAAQTSGSRSRSGPSPADQP